MRRTACVAAPEVALVAGVEPRPQPFSEPERAHLLCLFATGLDHGQVGPLPEHGGLAHREVELQARLAPAGQQQRHTPDDDEEQEDRRELARASPSPRLATADPAIERSPWVTW